LIHHPRDPLAAAPLEPRGVDLVGRDIAADHHRVAEHHHAQARSRDRSPRRRRDQAVVIGAEPDRTR
jgi:hypothetical protein